MAHKQGLHTSRREKGDLISKIKIDAQTILHTKYELNSFKNVATTYLPPKTAPSPSKPPWGGDLTSKSKLAPKLGLHTKFGLNNSKYVVKIHLPPKTAPPPPQEPPGGLGGTWLQKSKFATKLGLPNKFELNSSKYVVTTPSLSDFNFLQKDDVSRKSKFLQILTKNIFF